MNISLILATITLIGLLLIPGVAESSSPNPSEATTVTSVGTALHVADTTPTDSNVEPDAKSPQSGSTKTETPRDQRTSSPINASTIPIPIDSNLPDTTNLVAQTGLSLLAVIFLIWAVVQILKKFSPGAVVSSKNSHIRVLDRAHIAPKKSIYVVQIGDKALALGISDQQMTPLTDLDLEDTLARYAETTSIPVTQRFSDVMQAVNVRLSRPTKEPAT
ncbi:MAG: flagellar biosynthetic protein FliO [Candidatus Latescibacterota bacterium]|nr:flagellar biosynthetic protein FliO [Candidatus Latescibacterota bacterium]